MTYRETYGDFTNIKQVTLVKGIGKKMLARMQSSITVKKNQDQKVKSHPQSQPQFNAIKKA